MKTIVYYVCLCYIAFLIFTMDGDTLFCVCMEARTRVLTEMSKIQIHKKEVSGYAYNDVNMLLMQIERTLERELFKD